MRRFRVLNFPAFARERAKEEEMKLNMFFLLFDVMILLAYPFIFIASKARKYLSFKEIIAASQHDIAEEAAMKSMNDVLGVIMGGGKGARLHPLTQMRSKPAVPIAEQVSSH
ncbi:MAG: sugar phosphate nucleotidyltransferase [Ignavibacteriales bacterium]|nr:sugar phosphate nucleotidyltransferase [Ignavibacteriales bacterium]